MTEKRKSLEVWLLVEVAGKRPPDKGTRSPGLQPVLQLTWCEELKQMRSAHLSLPAPLSSYTSLSESVSVQQEEVKYQTEAPLWGRIEVMGSKLLTSLFPGKCHRTHTDQGAQASE